MSKLIGLVVLAGIGIGVYFAIHSFTSFDPDKEGAEVQAKIKPGMTFDQVLDIAGENAKYQGISRQKTIVNYKEVEKVVIGSPVELRPDRIRGYLKQGSLTEGFYLIYTYSARTAFSIAFDPGGKVVSVQRERTVGDLFNPPAADDQ